MIRTGTRRSRRFRGSRTRTLALALAAGAAALAAEHARATWSIIIIDTRTGEIAVGSATCLTNFDLRAGTPVLITGVGAATAQSFVDSTGQNRVFIRDHLLFGTDPEQIVALLADFDSGHQTRQYGIADVLGRAATFSGTGAGQWAGGRVGRTGPDNELVYAVQGNILTGASVVDEAVRAIEETPGDLGEKLMAAMEAARAEGGDRRCSCAGSDECPPPDFRKSSHIAYMLIARTGDPVGCNGIYRTPGTPRGVSIADLDGDGLADVVAAAHSGNDGAVSARPNITADGWPFVVLGEAHATPAGGQLRGVVTADFNGDGVPDAAAADFTGDAVQVLLGAGDGTLGPAVAYATGDGPLQLAVADLDGVNGPDLAVANSLSGDLTVLLNDGDGTFTPGAPLAAGPDVRDVVAADVDGDDDLDLLAAVSDENKLVQWLNDGGASFTRGLDAATGPGPRAVAPADFNEDGRTDLAVALESSVVQILTNTGVGYTGFGLTIGTSASDLAVADLNNDGHADLAIVSSTRLIVAPGRGNGFFEPRLEHVLNSSGSTLTLGDLNDDGWVDAAVASNSGVLVVENLGGGVFNSGQGCATGDYYMNFNIAFQTPQADDPVFQLQVLFDQWRADLEGRPDAVVSAAALDPARLVAGSGRTAVLAIDLRDLNGGPVSAPIASVSVEHAPTSAGLSQIGPVVDLGGGRYEAAITAGDHLGVDRFRVRVDDGVRPVFLMPDPALRLTANPDFNGDGVVDHDDYVAFRAAFLAGDARADLDGDGTLDVHDFVEFFEAARE